MMQKPFFKMILLCLVAMLAACAPANLDVTPTLTPAPTLTPTDVPSPTPTVEITATPVPDADVVSQGIGNLDFVNLIVASFPDVIGTGMIEWRPDPNREPVDVNNVDGGNAKRVFITERGGGQGSIMFGVFDSPEAAQTYYEFIKGLRAALEGGVPRDNFPEPNLFGSGLYGSAAITTYDNIFVEVQIEIMSGAAGDPLPGLMRQALNIVEEGTALASTGPIELDPILQSLVDAVPETFTVNDAEWSFTQMVPILVETGTAVEMQYTSGTAGVSVYLGKFNTPTGALAAYNDILSRGTTGVLVNELVIAIRSDEEEIAMLREVLAFVESVIVEG